MAELLPFRRARRWTRASDYGAPKPGRRSGGGKRGWLRAARESGPILWAAPLAVGVAVFLATAPGLREGGLSAASPLQSGPDRERASFARCGGSSGRDNCVVDGDTFWYRGEKIRVADINTPEVSRPKCAREAELGAKATARFTELLNVGPFTLEPVDRSHDRYGRALFVVTRDGASLGGALVREGLAEEWRGFRRAWC